MLMILIAAIPVALKAEDVAQVKSRAEQIRSMWENASCKKVLVVAHRAAWKKAPENSRLAVLHAIDMKADIIEIDIRKTKDGKFVLMHDSSVNRTTNGKGEVQGLMFEDIRKLRLKGPDGELTNEQVPTLSEILLLCKDKIMINLDKAGAYIKEILPILKTTGTTRQVILKGRLKPEEVSRLLGKNRDIIYMPIFSIKDTTNLKKENEELSVDQIYPMGKNVRVGEFIFRQFDNPAVSDAVMQKFKEKNVRAWVNTLDVCHPSGYVDKTALKNPDKVWGALIGKGFSVIQTDEPEALLDYLRTKGLHD